MGQRSFSISKIDELYLCYDKGQNGATIQKMSRALTPDGLSKVGKIFSLSFDSNRDDKFDDFLLSAAINRTNYNSTETDIKEELKRVFNSIDIFSCTDSNTIEINTDSFVDGAFNRGSISKAMGKATNLIGMSDDEIAALANGNVNYIKNAKKEVALMGKTKEIKNRNSNGVKQKTPQQLKDLQKVREMLTTIYEHSDILIRSSKPFGATNIKEAFGVFEIKKWQPIIASEFGVSYDIIKHLFETGRINENYVNILHKN